MRVGRRILLLTVGLGFFLASCGGAPVNSPLSREEKRIYRLEEVTVEVLPSVPVKTIARDLEGALGSGWRYWLFGYRPLLVRIEIHELSSPSSSLQRLFGTSASLTTRIVITDKETGSVLDDFTRVTRGGYEGLSFGGIGQEEQRDAQRRLAELFVDEFRLMFYFGLD
jgi:hypothetical protein